MPASCFLLRTLISEDVKSKLMRGSVKWKDSRLIAEQQVLELELEHLIAMGECYPCLRFSPNPGTHI